MVKKESANADEGRMGRRYVQHGCREPSHDEWIGVGHGVLRFIEELKNVIGHLQAQLGNIEAEHREQLAERDRRIGRTERELAKVKQELSLAREQLKTTSRNSSKPPSSDPLSAPKRAPRRPSGKRRGGQPHHPVHARELVPVEEIAPERLVDHKPASCDRCGERLEGEDPSPLRHQIVDVPPVVVEVWEHRLHSLRCACGHTTRACLPEGVSGKGFGPGVEAAAATMAGTGRLSHRSIQELMRDLLGVRMGLGTVPTLLDRAGQAVAAAVDEARDFVRVFAGVKNVDETPWLWWNADGSNEAGRTAYLWVVATQLVTTFDIALSRGQEVAKRLLGDVPIGVLVTDRCRAYQYVDVSTRQLCWAHLYRNFVQISERTGEAGKLGHKLVKLTERLFELWTAYRDGELEEAMWKAQVEAIRFRFHGLLERGSKLSTRPGESSVRTKTKNTCAEVLGVEAALWTFVERPGIGMTNNAAERALRHAVLWRRASFGTQSASGAERVARLLTVVQTLRSRSESVHGYFLEACRAANEGRAAPSLLPKEAEAAASAAA